MKSGCVICFSPRLKESRSHPRHSVLHRPAAPSPPSHRRARKNTSWMSPVSSCANTRCGTLRLAARRRLMPVDVNLQGRDVTYICMRYAIHAPPIDGADRQHVHQHVERDRVLPLADAEEAGQQSRGRLRPHALDRGERTKQRIEGRGARHAPLVADSGGRVNEALLSLPSGERKQPAHIARPARSHWTQKAPMSRLLLRRWTLAAAGCAIAPGIAAPRRWTSCSDPMPMRTPKQPRCRRLRAAGAVHGLRRHRFVEMGDGAGMRPPPEVDRELLQRLVDFRRTMIAAQP